MALLGLLAVTFHVGASPLRRTIVTEMASEMPTSFSTPTEVSLPVTINGRRARIIMPKANLASTRSSTCSSARTLSAQGRAPSEVKLADEDSPSYKPGDLSLDIQDHWVLGVFGDGEEKAARVSFSPPPSYGGTIGASFQSLRTISKAGPGNEANEWQVYKAVAREDYQHVERSPRSLNLIVRTWAKPHGLR